MKNDSKPNGLVAYVKIIHAAKLDLKCKALLWHYGTTYNWLEKVPSYYTQKQICAYVGMSASTYQRTRRRLLELGWIIESKRAFDCPVFVTPKIGTDDPKYSGYSWSKGHRDYKVSLEDAVASLPAEFRDPFEDSVKSKLDSNKEYI